jgi:hypothetical protein
MRLVGRIPELCLPDAAARSRIAANVVFRRDRLAQICAIALGAGITPNEEGVKSAIGEARPLGLN